MIGILTLIIAIMAIVVTIYLWKNSNEQKELYKETLRNVENSFNAQASILIEGMLKSKSEEIDLQIEKRQAEAASLSIDLKDSINKEIEDLKTKKADIGKDLIDFNKMKDMLLNSTGLRISANGNCIKCGKKLTKSHSFMDSYIKSTKYALWGTNYDFNNSLYSSDTINMDDKYDKIECLTCGEINYIQK